MSEKRGTPAGGKKPSRAPATPAGAGPAEQVMRTVTADEVLDLARRLVSIPSYGPEHQWEAGVAEALDAVLTAEGITVRRQPVRDGRANLIASLPGLRDGRPLLMFNGHMDTVPPSAAMAKPPFAAEVSDGLLWGRGAADMKGGLAALVMALVALHRARVRLSRPVLLAAVAMEEMGNVGTFTLAQAMAADGFPASFALVGEPTGLDVVAAHKGVDRYRITVFGRAAHGSTPEKGINAIVQASRLIVALDDQLIRSGDQPAHPLLGAASYNIGTIEGGVSRNTVPDRCTFDLEKRYLPGDDPAHIRGELERVAEQTVGIGGVELVRDPGYSQVPHLPFDIAPDHSLVRTLARSVRETTGREPEITGWPAFTDASVLQALGTPAVVCGPGALEMAHTDGERVPVVELHAAMASYIRLALLLSEADIETTA
jgi:acetylornithine deacetylase/succinyl-diaminopimelate desuccinylase family protein